MPRQARWVVWKNYYSGSSQKFSLLCTEKKKLMSSLHGRFWSNGDEVWQKPWPNQRSSRERSWQQWAHGITQAHSRHSLMVPVYLKAWAIENTHEANLGAALDVSFLCLLLGSSPRRLLAYCSSGPCEQTQLFNGFDISEGAAFTGIRQMLAGPCICKQEL